MGVEGMKAKVEVRGGLLLGWCAALLVGTALFHSLGDGALSAPPLSPSDWSEWAAVREPTIVGMVLLRLVTLGLCWYLVGVTTVGLVARLLRAARLIRIADALTVPWLRRLLQQGLGVALATAMVTSAAGVAPVGGARLSGASSLSTTMTLAAATPDVTAPPQEIAIPPLGPSWTVEGPALRPERGPRAEASEVPALRPERGPRAEALDAADVRVELQLPWQLFTDADEGSGGSTAPRAPDVVEVPLSVEVPLPAEVPIPVEVGNGQEGAGRDAGPGVSAGAQVEAGSGAAGSDEPTTGRDGASYTVRAGDSLWRIAEQQLTRELGRVPSSAEVVPYWRAVIEANQRSLPDPDDPDLILPGQLLTVPPLLPLPTR